MSFPPAPVSSAWGTLSAQLEFGQLVLDLGNEPDQLVEQGIHLDARDIDVDHHRRLQFQEGSNDFDPSRRVKFVLGPGSVGQEQQGRKAQANGEYPHGLVPFEAKRIS